MFNSFVYTNFLTNLSHVRLLENEELSPPEDNPEQPLIPVVNRLLPPILPQRRGNPNSQPSKNLSKSKGNEEKCPKGHKKRRRYENSNRKL
jgi:hypothetical protein